MRQQTSDLSLVHAGVGMDVHVEFHDFGTLRLAGGGKGISPSA